MVQQECLSCGRPLTATALAQGAVRHRSCSNRVTATAQSDLLAPQDTWLLEQAGARSIISIAEELGLTRQAVYHRVKKAKERAR